MEPETRRGPGRPPSSRDDAPRATDGARDAAARAAAIRDHLGGDLDEGPDEFFIAEGDKPEGWSYEWKRSTVYGKEDPAYEVALARKGWEPVPASRHPSYMPKGSTAAFIERGGQILMERPKEITEEVKALERRKALDQVGIKEKQLGLTPDGQLPRDADPRTKPRISKSYSPVGIPKE